MPGLAQKLLRTSYQSQIITPSAACRQYVVTNTAEALQLLRRFFDDRDAPVSHSTSGHSPVPNRSRKEQKEQSSTGR